MAQLSSSNDYWIEKMLFYNDDKEMLILTNREKSPIEIWNVSDQRLVGEINLKLDCSTFDLSPDKSTLAICSTESKVVLLYSIKTKSVLSKITLATNVYEAKFSECGRYLAVISDTEVAIYDSKSKLLFSKKGNFTDLHFSSDSKYICSYEIDDKKLFKWDFLSKDLQNIQYSLSTRNYVVNADLSIVAFSDSRSDIHVMHFVQIDSGKNLNMADLPKNNLHQLQLLYIRSSNSVIRPMCSLKTGFTFEHYYFKRK
ncbi:MAG: hypothetical protein R3B84_03060 [Zavarzinella sp.]